MHAHVNGLRLGGVAALLVAMALGLGTPAWPQSRTHRSYFVGPDGVPLLTNRPEAYRDNFEFKEVRIDFVPIETGPGNGVSWGRGGFAVSDLGQIVRHYARLYGLDEHIVLAVIKAESDFDPYAVSTAGARGLMQLMPGTAAEMQVADPYDPEQNVAAGTQYLSKLMDLFDRNIDHALAAYNAGPGPVKKHGGVPPYPETRAYVRKVKRFALEFARADLTARLQLGTHWRARDELPSHGAPFLVHFRNGSTQPAHQVEDRGRYYVLDFAGRRYTVWKSVVVKIVRAG